MTIYYLIYGKKYVLLSLILFNGNIMVLTRLLLSLKKTDVFYIPSWTFKNSNFMWNWSFPTVKLFKHGLQAIYSKKGVVEFATQFRAFMRYHNPHLKIKYESQLVTQTNKILVVNCFIPCRIFKCSENLGTLESLVSLETLRDKLNHFYFLLDFFYEGYRQLFVHADLIWTSELVSTSLT